PEAGIVVSMIAIVVTLALTRYQKHVIAKTGSVAIGADRIHYTSDLLLNGAVIVALDAPEAKSACIRFAGEIAQGEYYKALATAREVIAFEDAVAAPQ
ncbi:hypothetical protein GY966_23425, partial [Escherichia coli]|nr:hypothetical protein [Escherichia coli]